MNTTQSNTTAALIRENEFEGGMELRFASPGDNWPGYAWELEEGYWLGTHRKHVWIGTSLSDALKEWEFWNP